MINGSHTRKNVLEIPTLFSAYYFSILSDRNNYMFSFPPNGIDAIVEQRRQLFPNTTLPFGP